uniref:Uncharacterized protein n=1 Tax=Anguilla anguilla TaxID=7936 RepID=A0A0E9UQL0_ANGAN
MYRYSNTMHLQLSSGNNGSKCVTMGGISSSLLYL